MERCRSRGNASRRPGATEGCLEHPKAHHGTEGHPSVPRQVRTGALGRRGGPPSRNGVEYVPLRFGSDRRRRTTSRRHRSAPTLRVGEVRLRRRVVLVHGRQGLARARRPGMANGRRLERPWWRPRARPRVADGPDAGIGLPRPTRVHGGRARRPLLRTLEPTCPVRQQRASPPPWSSSWASGAVAVAVVPVMALPVRRPPPPWRSWLTSAGPSTCRLRPPTSSGASRS